jgi:hypothetical protein
MALFMASIARISFGLIRLPFLRRALGNRKRILYLVVGIQVQRMESDNSVTAWVHTTTALGTHSRILHINSFIPQDGVGVQIPKDIASFWCGAMRMGA